MEKLASAIYFLTSFFSDQEPVKWRLRGLSMNLISSEIRDKEPVFKELSSLLSISRNTGLISSENYDILNNELVKLEQNSKKSLSFFLPQEMTLTDSVLPKPPKLENPREEIKPNLEQDKDILKEFGAVSVKKNRRQSIIIGILKRKKEVMIKDITPLISGCSEKTIQRELSSMVDNGLLKREGEKRWSRYSLA